MNKFSVELFKYYFIKINTKKYEKLNYYVNFTVYIISKQKLLSVKNKFELKKKQQQLFLIIIIYNFNTQLPINHI